MWFTWNITCRHLIHLIVVMAFGVVASPPYAAPAKPMAAAIAAAKQILGHGDFPLSEKD
jgi:hypothetical protein